MAGSDAGVPIGAQILFLILLILINAFFAAAEIALVSANKNKIKNLDEEGSKRAKRLLELMDAPNKFLSTIQVVITFAGFLASAAAAVGLSDELATWFKSKNVPFSVDISVVIITIVLAFVTLVLGELYPKRVALQHAEGMALFCAGPIRVLSIILKPFVWLLSVTVNGFLTITRQKTAVEEEEFDEEEVKSMLEVGQESGVLKEEGKKMMDNLFAFDDKLAYEIMTPRTDVFSIDIEDDIEEYIDELMELKYSRIPVYQGESDKIVGIVYIKDFFIKARMDGFDNVSLEEIMRKPYLAPETKNIDSLFFELQKTKQHIAILIDEYGGFSGIVTMEDIIEEIVGDIDDEYDEESDKIEALDERTFRLDGNMDIDDVNEELGTDFESENSETIGGLLIEELGEIPAEDGERTGDSNDEERVIHIGRCTFTIESVHDRRIEDVVLHIGCEPSEEEEELKEADKDKQKEKQK